jgi:hypothetical protein
MKKATNMHFYSPVNKVERRSEEKLLFLDFDRSRKSHCAVMDARSTYRSNSVRGKSMEGAYGAK